MKKLLLVLLSCATIFTFAGCKKKTKTKKTTTASNVTQSQDDGNNLIGNGDFSYGEVEVADSGDRVIYAENGGEWWLYGLEGGGGRMSINDQRQVEVGVVATAGKMHGVQFAYDGFAITKGSKYVFEFDAKCNVARQFEVRIQYNGAGYENYLMEGKKGNLIESIGTEMTHFRYEFTSFVSNAAPRMALNLGAFDGDPDIDPAKQAADQPTFLFTFDNFKLVCVEDSGEKIDTLHLGDRPKITLNQVGFLPNQVKQAVFRSDDSSTMDRDCYIYDCINEEITDYQYQVKVLGINQSSKEFVGFVDFSNFKEPGRYKLVGFEYCGESPEFVIGDDVYTDLTNDLVMMLYRQRCGVVKGAEGDKFAHAACHQDEAYIYGTTTKIDVSGGWHDAGDYGKYVVAGAQTVANLLMTYEKTVSNSSYVFFSYDDYVENDAAIPDLLEEAKYELDWMLKMQNAEGQVYHKVSTKDFPGIEVLPQNDHADLYVSPVSYAATADFAAVMAYASRVFQTAGLTSDAATYLAAAEAAFDALATMQKKSFVNPSDISTGEYPDSDLNDELAWAAIELYATTSDDKYLTSFTSAFNKNTDLGFGWANVNGFAAYGALKNLPYSGNETLYSSIAKAFIDYADKMVEYADADVYNVTIEGDDEGNYVFEWGSNLTVAGNAIVLDLAVEMLENVNPDALGFLLPEGSTDLAPIVSKRIKSYTKVKQCQFNYLLGQNACAYCFVTGYGTLTPENPHHRPSVANGEAMKGMVIGGPDSNFAANGNDSVATRNCTGYAPAHCYIDNNNSWSTNEITIYWNSPVIYLAVSVISDELALA